MLVGVPKEIKVHEYRVGLTPASAAELTGRGHSVLVQTGAGAGIGAGDEDYIAVGARIAADAAEVFARADMVVKVKEPQAVERKMLRPGQTLFTYLHLAADKPQAEELLASDAIGIAYETVTAYGGGLPLLAPMSEVAGRMSVQAAAHSLEKSQGGMGVLLGGVPGTEPAKVVVLGGGIVGSNAVAMAMGMGADVTVIDQSIAVLRNLTARFGLGLKTAVSTRETVARLLRQADAVIIGVLVPGAAAPKLITAADVKAMKPGSVIVDVAIDQGGGAETSRPTTHSDPTYIVDGVVHYCVANMPGAVARTSTYALNNATLPFVLQLADMGTMAALRTNPHLAAGLNIFKGALTEPSVARDLGLKHTSRESVIA
ncbi:MAG TPA: alanine dehydrogenase [Rhizomicrobium sp.]|jgi:alanine dehydrogenase|nr:alanine dehydrogenase [Rhizomicrobium sp.]